MTRGLDPIEDASIDELRALQLQRLKWSVRHAYEHVDHYRRGFDRAGMTPGDIRRLEDLKALPYLTGLFTGGLGAHYGAERLGGPRRRWRRTIFSK